MRLMAQNEARGWPGMLGIGRGKTARRHGTGSIVARVVMQQLFLRSLPLRIYVFGIDSLVCQEHSMISMYWKGLVYLRG